MLPANVATLVYVSVHYVELVKYFTAFVNINSFSGLEVPGSYPKFDKDD